MDENFWIYRLYKWFNFNNLYINVVRNAQIFVIIKIYDGFVAIQILRHIVLSTETQYMEKVFLQLQKYYYLL